MQVSLTWRWHSLGISRCSGLNNCSVRALCRSALGCCYSDGIRVGGVNGDVNAIAHGEECVEALYKQWIPIEKSRDAIDDAWSVNAARVSERNS